MNVYLIWGSYDDGYEYDSARGDWYERDDDGNLLVFKELDDAKKQLKNVVNQFTSEYRRSKIEWGEDGMSATLIPYYHPDEEWVFNIETSVIK